jgi:hypothetical protein
MKTKLLRKLRRQAEKKIGVWKMANGIYRVGYLSKYITEILDVCAIEYCKEMRRKYICSQIDRLRPPKRIF